MNDPLRRLTRVLVVDDSAFARKVLREVLEAAHGIVVVGTARDGLDALEKIDALAPDVVTVDLVMPGLDGVGLIRALAERPSPPRAVVVTTADEDSDVAVDALRAGAYDVVHKPTSVATDRLYELGADLVAKVRAAAVTHAGDVAERRVVPPPIAEKTTASQVDLVVIGASTGGPQALTQILRALPANFPVPIAIVLHMPAGYTAAFADRVDRESALDVLEARDDLELVAGRVAIARAGMHLRVEKTASGGRARLDAAPFDTLHRPSVDVLFQTAAVGWGARTLGVVLTGMGSDGLEGARAIHARGGRILVEAESSCVVYGMPRSVSEAHLAHDEVPLGRIVQAIYACL